MNPSPANLIRTYLNAVEQASSKQPNVVNENWSKNYKRSIDCSRPKGFSQKAHCAGRKKRRTGGETISKSISEQIFKIMQIFEDLQSNRDEVLLEGLSVDALEVLRMLSTSEILNEDLRKWFKQKWVRFGPDGKIRGACARGSKSEGKPKCLPKAKAHAMGKKGRAKAAGRKRRKDPNPERKGKAKNIATKESIHVFKEAKRVLASVTKAKTAIPSILKKVQVEYDKWDESDLDTYAGGGICHIIADKICDVFLSIGIECTTVSCSHEQHVYVVIKVKEGVYSVDIPYHIYETGGGFNWKKIPNIAFEPSHVVFYQITSDPKRFDDYISEAQYNPISENLNKNILQKNVDTNSIVNQWNNSSFGEKSKTVFTTNKVIK
jgi:hypothetical protein